MVYDLEYGEKMVRVTLRKTLCAANRMIELVGAWDVVRAGP